MLVEHYTYFLSSERRTRSNGRLSTCCVIDLFVIEFNIDTQK